MGLFSKKSAILVVEDEIDIAESIKARLELENYSVRIANDGNAGAELARSMKPDLIIMDVMMPKVNGFEVCKVLKQESKTKDIPILILTALPHLQDAEKAFAAGADDFLNKPFSNDRLLQKVRKLLEK